MNMLLYLYITEIEQCLLIYKKKMGKSKWAMVQWLRCRIPSPDLMGWKLSVD